VSKKKKVIAMSASRARRSLPQVLLEWLRRLRRPKPQPPGDPYAERLVPVQRGPKGRSGAALAEPDDDADFFFPPRKQ